MGDIYDIAPPGWGNRSETPEEKLERRIHRLEKVVKQQELTIAKLSDHINHCGDCRRKIK